MLLVVMVVITFNKRPNSCQFRYGLIKNTTAHKKTTNRFYSYFSWYSQIYIAVGFSQKKKNN